MASKYFYVGFLFFGLLAFVDAKGYSPAQGFFVAVNSPVLGRAEDAVTLYAIHTNNHDADNTVQFKKEGGLVAHTVLDGQIKKGGVIFGCFLRVGLPDRYRGTRYGTYDATFTPGGSSMVVERYGFVRSRSDILDTRGVYTHTVWPASSGAKTPIDNFQDNNIGVRWSPGCRSIQWCKGKKRNVNTGPRLQLTSTDDAGVYTIRRGKRGARGWFVQIKVIAASCQRSEYLNTDDECVTRTYSIGLCENGGVVKDAADTCLCPPFFAGQSCANAVDVPAKRDFVLAYNGDGDEAIRCGDLDGGNPKCRGHLFCLGDLYGCTCASGWWGSNCDRPCAKGKWGVGCSQNCGQDNPDCDRFFGP